MSKIRLHGSSSGHTEVAPAAAAGNNTVTLPNSAGTLLLTDGSAASLTEIPAANIVGVCTSGLTKTGGFGKIVQVVSTTKTDVFSESKAGGAITGDVTGLTVSITPTNASNKILLMPSVSVGHPVSATSFILLYKDGSVISDAQAPAANDGNGNEMQRATFGADSGVTGIANITGNYLDTAGGTSSITYSIRLGNIRNDATYTMYVNRSGDSDEAASYRLLARYISTFTAVEITA